MKFPKYSCYCRWAKVFLIVILGFMSTNAFAYYSTSADTGNAIINTESKQQGVNVDSVSNTNHAVAQMTQQLSDQLSGAREGMFSNYPGLNRISYFFEGCLGLHSECAS